MSSHHSLSPRKSCCNQSHPNIRSHEHSCNSEIIGVSTSSEINSSHNSEPEVIEDKPPSPLSLQQDGVFSLVQSPPFENDQLDSVSPENQLSNLLIHSNNQTLINLSGINSTVTDQKREHVPITNARNPNLQNMTSSERANSVSGDVSNPNCPDVVKSFRKPKYSPRDSVSQQPITDSVAASTIGSSDPVFSLTARETNLSLIASRKSVKELYGQPSWWGDGDSGYSYPHTSSFGNQETVHPVVASRKYSMKADINLTSEENSTRPPAEAFVIDFGSSKPRLERPASLSGSLSQCVPLKLRQGLDERERRIKEKQLEVKKQSTSGMVNKNTVTTMSNSKFSTTTTKSRTNMNEIQKTHSRGASLSAKGSTVRTNTATSNITSNVTATTTTTTSGRSSSTTINKKPQVTMTKLDKRITSKPDSSLRTGRVDCATNLTSNSTNASRSNLTDRSRGRLFSQTNNKEPTQSNRTNVKPPFSVGGRRISAGAASLTSQRTAPSQLNRSKISVVARGSLHLSTTGLTDSRSNLRGVSSATRQSTVKHRGVNRSFMTPTTSSDAKQVKTRESIRSMPNESPISSSPKCDSRRTYESPIGNSAKKPITSTFLRRGTAQGRIGIGRKLSTDNINQYSNSNKSSSCISDRIASVVSTIEAYDDPKAYLFYRMFQGVEEIETTTTDGIFQAFSPYSSVDFQKQFSPEFNDTNEQLNYHLHSYGIDETFPKFQTNSNVQNKYSGMLLSVDDEETPYQDLPSHHSDLTTISTSNSRTLATKTPVYLSKCYKNEIPTSQTQNIVKSSTVSNSKVHCTTNENDDATMDPTLKSMNLSMFVSTSVTSLAPSQTGTYVIDGGDGIDDDNDDNNNNTNQDFLQHSDEQNIHLYKDNDLITPRGSPKRDITAEGELLNRRSTNHLSNNQQTKQLPQFEKDFENSMLPVEHVQTLTAHHQYSGNKRLNDSISTVDLTKTPSNEKPLCITSSTVCLTETHDNKLQDSKNKKDVLSHLIDNLEDSDHVGISLTSLTPSHTGTYILDIDDTLIAQGVLPVIIRSHETLASSVTTIDSGLNIESAMNTHGVIVENITPRGSPISKETLWHIVENDNDDESRDNNDLVLVTSNQSGRPYNVSFDNCNNELSGQFTMESLRAEFEDTYKSLPSPNQFLGGADSSDNSMNIVESSTLQSESRKSQMKTMNAHPVQGKESNRTIPSVNTSNITLQHINYFVKPKSINCTEVSISNHLQNDLITKQNMINNTYTHKDEKYSSVHIPPNDGVSLPTTVSLKLPDSSSSKSSSSNSPSTSSSCSNHILKYNREVTDGLDLNNQNIEHFNLTHNLNNKNNNNMNEHHLAYNSYTGRRYSDNYEHSKFLSHNNSNLIPSTTGNPLYNVSETIGNHCHITISKRQDNTTITNLQSINNNSNCTKITSTTPFSLSYHDPNTMNQLLTRLNSMPATHYSRPDQSRNMIRTHSCSRGKSRYYSHGSASVPDPASPVRSWSSISSGTEHSLTNRIICKSRKQLNDQTDSGFIETRYLMKTLNTNKPLPQGSSSTYLENKSDHFLNSYDYNRTTNLSQYNEDIKFKKSNEIDSRTYTRRKHSRSNDQDDPQKYLTTLDAESYQTWVARMSELAQGLNSLAKEPLFQSDGSCSEENKNEFQPINRLYPDVKTINLPLINDNLQTMPTLPDSTTDPGLSEIVECSAFTTPLPHRTLETMLSVAPENLSNYQKFPLNNTKKLNLPTVQNGRDEKFTDFILSPQSFQLSSNFDPDSSDPNESAIYYSLMVDTIRYLSIKLRQFSDKLAYRLSYNQQQANASGSNTTELSSRYVSIQQNRDDVQSSTKYALHDTFENMKAVNQQLQVVGKLLFSKNNDNITNELNQIDNATSCEYLHKLEQFNQELYRFIPIEPANIHHHPNINTTISTTNKFIQIPNTNLQSVLTDEQHSNFVNKSTSVSTNQVMMNTTSALNTHFTTDDNTNTINNNSSTSRPLSHPFTSKSTTSTTTNTTTVTTVHSSNIHVISLTGKSNDNMINKQELLEDEYY
ncbi:unnamed protein product [Schistosoma rodhaini]|nr:unnamed protein product [Schistosoma rodhaini]